MLGVPRPESWGFKAFRKGKRVERRGRKAMGLGPCSALDCQAAEESKSQPVESLLWSGCTPLMSAIAEESAGDR